MIRLGISGYGNLGRGVEAAVMHNPDIELKVIFTRRDPASITPITKGVKVEKAENAAAYKDEIDVLILCGGSATDLPVQTPQFAAMFNVVDSFDTHANIPAHFEEVDGAAKKSGKLALISCGWDPGMFSIARVYGDSVLPGGATYTFWGKGVSQGHSDAIRRVEGVVDARQSTREKHTRECYVVVEEGADKARIEKEIKEMPNYFADYDTTVNFISQEELNAKHKGIPHGGFVIRSGKTGADDEFNNVVEYSLKLDSNPAFTSSVLVAYARAVARMSNEGKTGCVTVLDIPPAYLSAKSGEELRKSML